VYWGTFMVAREAGDDSPSVRINLKQRDLKSNEGRGKHSEVNWRAVRLPVISVAVIDEHLFTRECIATSLKTLGDNLEVASFAACHDCLQSTNSYDLVLYHAHQSIIDDHSRERLPCLAKLMQICPLVILSVFDSPESVLEAFESGVTGYIPTATTSVKLAIEIIRLIRAGGTFVPLSTLLLREPNQRGAALPAIGIGGLTARQMQVLDRLRLGKANKIIAYELGLSESTIKVEIHNIMKKMNATNRTEVACRAHAFVPGRGA
jgi:DNA-binding NarL/FixJ family response regulator